MEKQDVDRGRSPVPWHSAVKQLARGVPGSSFGPTSSGSFLPANSQQSRIGMSSLVQPAQLQFENFKQDAPNVDLEGGRLLGVEEHEEIDTDGWRQRVYTYTILAADGCTEVTKTIRTKIKLDCTSMYRRLQVTNGVEAKVEEKCERVVGDIRGLGPVQNLGYNQRKLTLDPNDAQDKAIYDTLVEVPETFKKLLNKEQDSFMKLFPDLFSNNLKTKSTLFPIQNTELIHNDDGTTTRRTRSSKSYSQSYSTQDVYINGVKQDQMSQRRFRAFVEYKGSDYGFRVKVSDNASDDLSEDETEDDDKTSRTHSELTDADSDVIGLGNVALRPEVKKRHERAWFAAKELIDSEQRYVEKLRLLADIFLKRVAEEKILDKDRLHKLFANISSLYQFHNTHFLPQLMEAGREWEHTKRIANVVRKQAPFLKMYSEYTNNYDRATKIYEEAKKKKRFAEIVHEIEELPECEGLPLGHHLICPVQRVMRYQLLLQEYKKYMADTDVDYDDTTVALQLVLQAATHANEMMKKLERFGKVITVQEELGNSISLVSPGRELLRQDVIQKISSKTEKPEERTLFLFNDFILLASERRLGMGRYRLRAVFHPCHTQVCEGDNLEREHSFYLRGSDGNGPQRCVELFCDNSSSKQEWVEALCKVIDDCRANSATFSGSQRSSLCEANNNSKESKNCADCDSEFSLWSRGIKCGKCRRKLCKKCFGRYRTESKNSRVCENCVKNTGTESLIRSQSTFSAARQNLLAVSAKGEGVLHSGFVKFRGSLGKTFERYFVVRNDFCLYSYNSPSDSHALVMLPLPGSVVRMCGEPYTFSLRIGTRRQYTITVENEDHQTKWMALLDLTSNAQLNNS
ncbi:unnamed protein product [Auanema sp. JU1783]|nr:unnamed protein product [Auanema sp. JU1783]